MVGRDLMSEFLILKRSKTVSGYVHSKIDEIEERDRRIK